MIAPAWKLEPERAALAEPRAHSDTTSIGFYHLLDGGESEPDAGLFRLPQPVKGLSYQLLGSWRQAGSVIGDLDAHQSAALLDQNVDVPRRLRALDDVFDRIADQVRCNAGERRGRARQLDRIEALERQIRFGRGGSRPQRLH